MQLKKLQIPHAFVLLTSVVFISSVASYFVPSGSFQRETKQIGSIERTLVIPGTYEVLDKEYSIKGAILGEEIKDQATPVSFFGFLSAIPRGMEPAGRGTGCLRLLQGNRPTARQGLRHFHQGLRRPTPAAQPGRKRLVSDRADRQIPEAP